MWPRSDKLSAAIGVGDALIDIAAMSVLFTSRLTVDRRATLRGRSNTSSAASLSGGGATGLLVVAPGAALVLQDLVLEDASAEYGGAVRLDEGSNLTARRCVFRRSVATDFAGGGALYVAARALAEVYASAFRSNALTQASASAGGGCVSVEETGRLLCDGCELSTSTGYLGACVRSEGRADFYRTNFSACVSTQRGGAIYLSATGSSVIVDSVVEKCEAVYGGGVHISGAGSVDVLRTNFSRNSATQTGTASNGDGGAAYVFGTAKFDACRFEDNWASAEGGAVYGSATITDSALLRNRAVSGGGFYGSLSCRSVQLRL